MQSAIKDDFPVKQGMAQQRAQPFECDKKEICAQRLSSVTQEIDNSFSHVAAQKSHSISIVKLYLVSLTGLLGYAAFVQTKVFANQPAGDIKFLMFSIFGISYTLIVFCLGWVLLSYLSHIICGISLSYKHISNMRFLKSLIFPNNSFCNNSIMPTHHSGVPIMFSRDLPIIFSIVNFLTLLLIYYYLVISVNHFWAFNITTFVLSIFAIFYPNACINFYKEILCAKLVTPHKNEEYVRSVINRKMNILKSTSYYKNKISLLKNAFIVFLIAKVSHVALYTYYSNYSLSLPYVDIRLSSLITLLELLSLLAFFTIRYLVERYKITFQPLKINFPIKFSSHK